MYSVVDDNTSSATTVVEPKNVFISVSPEAVYGWCIRLFLAAAVICGLLTSYVAKPDFASDPIIRVYGTFNVCITFDYEPARSFMAVVWIFIAFGVTVHAILFDFRLKVYFPVHSLIVKASWFFAFILSACFATLVLSLVHPPNGANENVMKHTIPYQVLIIGAIIWWIFNTICITHWPNPLHPRAVRIWTIATIVFVVSGLSAIYVQWVLILYDRGTISEHDLDRILLLPKWTRALLDPTWMFLLFFFRYFSPLSDKHVIMSMENDPRNVPGASNIFGYEILPEKRHR